VDPVTGERERSVLSGSAAARAGAARAGSLARHVGWVETPALREYVRAVGARVAAGSPRRDVPWRFEVTDMAEPNAFALPGGWVGVSRGLLLLMGSEDELAAALAHEVAHVAALDVERRGAIGPWLGLGAVLGAVRAALPGSPGRERPVARLGQVMGAGLLPRHDAAQERRADRLGQRLAAEAGWDPAAFSRLLANLSGWQRAHPPGPADLPDFLTSHPGPPSRSAQATIHAASLERGDAAPLVPSRDGFLARLDGLLVGPDPEHGFYRGSTLVHPALGVAMTVPAGWERAHQRDSALARAPDGAALLLLERQGPPAAPVRTGRRWLAEQRLERLNEAEGTVGDLPAYQVRARGHTDDGPVELLLTWIGHPEGLLRVTGASPPERFHRYALALDEAATSVRRLAPDDRRARVEHRLRVVRARAGESLVSLSRRTGNVWDAETTAAANGLPADAALASARLVKVAVAVRPGAR
jgi:predicted Zn-dependent protease